MVKIIPLQNGMVAMVDDEDYERCSKYIWYIRQHNGNIGYVSNNDGVSLGAFILSKNNEGVMVSYINGNKTDCRKKNLISITRDETKHVSKGRKNSSSKYKGVSLNKRNNKWRARIRNKHIGEFYDEDDAAIAYNQIAYELFGEHAYQNVIGEDNSVETINLSYKQPRTYTNKSSVGYRGVIPSGKKFRARIVENGKKLHLGNYDTPQEAAKAYDKKAFELHREKAVLNFPDFIIQMD